MSSRTQTYATFRDAYDRQISKVNRDVGKALPGADLVTIWAEGGEWPSYDVAYANFRHTNAVRTVDVDYVTLHSMDNLAKVIDTQLSRNSVVGLSLPCGMGKSTTLTREVARLKYGPRVVSVQPTMAVAAQLANFVVNTQGTPATFALKCEAMNHTGLHYIGIGTFFDGLLRGLIHEDDVIVIDEAHCVTFVHELTKEILCCMRNTLILLTASTGVSVSSLKGVVLKQVSGVDGEMSTQMAEQGPRALLVGVDEAGKYGASAALLTGATLDVNFVYDTGLRPDPRIKDGKLISSERLAVASEIIQAVGRVGRVGKPGRAYFNDKARAMVSKGVPLYEVLETSFRQYLGMLVVNDDAKERAKAIWQSSGFSTSYGKKVVAKERSPSPQRLLLSAAVPVTRKDSRLSTGSNVKSLCEWDEEVVSPLAVSQQGPVPAVTRWKTVATVPRSVMSQVRMTSVRQSGSSGGVTSQCRYVRRKSGEEYIEKKLTVDSGMTNTRKVSTGRHHVAGPSVQQFEKKGMDNRDLMITIMNCYMQREVMRPYVFLDVSSADVDDRLMHDARAVLARALLPSFSQSEVVSVMAWWNELCGSLVGMVPCEWVYQFGDYFKLYFDHISSMD